jgi:ABC-type glycerol-3-phosphate transport system permease component
MARDRNAGVPAGGPIPTGRARRPGKRDIVRYLVLAAGAFVCLLPFAYLIANALKTYSETVTRVSPNPFSANFWPAMPQWSNFAEVWQGDAFGHYFINSLIISLVTLAGTITTSCLAAYAFARLRFPGKEAIFSIFLVTLMIPETVTLIPNFLIVSALHWTDRLAGLTVPFLASAFYIFLLRQFFRQVPDSLVENARLDGATNLRILVSVVAPLSKAALFTVAFLDIAFSWNSLQWPLVVVQTPRWRPITVGLTRLISESGPQIQLRMAGALISLAPVVLVYSLAQSYIVESVSSAGIKE